MRYKYWQNLEVPSNVHGDFFLKNTYWRIRSYGMHTYHGAGGGGGFVYNFVRHGHNNSVSVSFLIGRHINFIKLINNAVTS